MKFDNSDKTKAQIKFVETNKTFFMPMACPTDDLIQFYGYMEDYTASDYHFEVRIY